MNVTRETIVMLVVLAVIVIGTVVGWYLPQSSRLSDLEDEIASRESALKTSTEQVSVVPGMVRRVEELKRQYTGWERRLPKQKELGGFLGEISTILSSEKLGQEEIKPGSPTQEDLYHTLPILMRFEGEYLSLASFLDRLDRMQRLTRVEKLHIRVPGEDKGGVDAPLDVELHMNIYFTEG